MPRKPSQVRGQREWQPWRSRGSLQRPREDWKESISAEGTAGAKALWTARLAGLGSGWVSVRGAGGAGGNVGAAPRSAAFC